MGIRYYKPVTKGRRGASVSDFAEITDRKKKPEKSLLVPAKKKGGRNFQGIVTSRFRGGGHKQMYRKIDFKRVKDNVWATVVSIEYDPNRTCRIALLEYEDKVKAYILAPEGLKAGEAYEPAQLLRGAIAYGAIVALQDPTYVAGVRTYVISPDCMEMTESAANVDPSGAPFVRTFHFRRIR